MCVCVQCDALCDLAQLNVVKCLVSLHETQCWAMYEVLGALSGGSLLDVACAICAGRGTGATRNLMEVRCTWLVTSLMTVAYLSGVIRNFPCS